jgi:hypothetical protein
MILLPDAHIVFVLAFLAFVVLFVCANWRGRRSP